MSYKLVVTPKAEELLDNILSYIAYRLRNPQVVGVLLKEIENIHDRLRNSPAIYGYIQEPFFRLKEYRKALVAHYEYVIIFRVDEESKQVYIVGYFHERELYMEKLSEPRVGEF